MRKKALIGIAVAAALGFSSCQKENVTVEEPSARLITETFSASFEQETTKTTIAEDETTGIKAVSWAKDDIVHYYTSDGGKVRKDTIKADGSSATLTLEREEGDTCYNLVYTGSTAPTFATRTSNSMVFNGVRTAQDGTFSNANVSVAHTAPGSGSIKFKPVTALVKFTTSRTDIKTIVLSGGAGTESVAGSVSVDPTAEKPIATLSGTGSTSITVTIGTPKAGTYYINVLPVAYSKGLKLTLKNSSGGIIGTIATKSIDLSVGGKMINLGNIDSHINDLSSAGTANCYIVSSAGTYKFKAVKGNSSTSVGDVKSVKVLWESYGTSTAPATGDLIKAAVSYADGYITFTTGSKSFTNGGGNAVIAAKDSSGTILWSWHIWLTDMPASKVYNNTAGTMMDRNLGARAATATHARALGLLYQWGRKDPFLGSWEISDNSKAKSTGSWPSATASTYITGTIEYVVKNPMQFITNSTDPNDWKYFLDNTLWQASKTIYDPCPPGWRVPDGGDSGIWSKAFGASSSFSGGPWNKTNKGMNFGSGNGKGTSMQLGTASVIWYPAAGYLGTDSGSLYGVGDDGRYWSCTPSDSKACNFNFDNDGNVYPSGSSSRARGYSVRCVSE